MLSVNVCVAGLSPNWSLTVTVTEFEDGVAGVVPEMTPVLALMVRPDGRLDSGPDESSVASGALDGRVRVGAVDECCGQRRGCTDRQSRHRGSADGDPSAVREHDGLDNEGGHGRGLRVSGDVELRLLGVDRAVEHDRPTVGQAWWLTFVSAAACQSTTPSYVAEVVALSVTDAPPLTANWPLVEIDEHATGAGQQRSVVADVETTGDDVDTAGEGAGVATGEQNPLL